MDFENKIIYLISNNIQVIEHEKQTEKGEIRCIMVIRVSCFAQRNIFFSIFCLFPPNSNHEFSACFYAQGFLLRIAWRSETIWILHFELRPLRLEHL